MPEKRVIKRAKADLRRGASATTAAGEFVREEFHHARSGKHPVKSKKQAVAIGLSKARRAGIPLPPQGETSAKRTKASPRSRKRSAAKRSRGTA